MSRKATTPSYVVELPLEVSTPEARRQLLALFSAGTRLTNVMVQHGRNVVAAVRADPAWAAARKLPNKTLPQRKARQAAFAAVRRSHDFSEYAFHAVVARHKNSAGFKGRVGSNVAQKIASRIFKAFDEHLFGSRGQPRFKSRRRPLHSLEEKNHATGIRWDAERCEVLVQDLRLPVRLPDLRKDEWLASALQDKTKYCRLLWRQVRGTRRYYVQLVQEGLVPVKASVLARRAPAGSLGGLDVGPSTVAWVTDTAAGLVSFCEELNTPWQAIRRLQRHLDRQRRANNPENYNPDGTVKKGRKVWQSSRRQRATEARLRHLQGQLARKRANAHGVLANRLLTQACGWRDDGVSIKALQRNFGRSVGMRAPGMFLTLLHRKAERAGGARIRQDARVLKTSQYDHSTHTFAKKALSERWHVFGDGRGRVQRDIYSAFLARNAVEMVDADGVIGWTHDPVVLEAAWQRIAPALEAKGYFIREGCRIAPVRARTAASSDKVHTLVCAGLAPVESFA